MLNARLITQQSFIFSGVVFLLSTLLFFFDSGRLLDSLAAACLAAGLSWVSYVLIRILVLALRR